MFSIVCSAMKHLYLWFIYKDGEDHSKLAHLLFRYVYRKQTFNIDTARQFEFMQRGFLVR